jgi:hypothetical protein
VPNGLAPVLDDNAASAELLGVIVIIAGGYLVGKRE